jgi:hypothetical protein
MKKSEILKTAIAYTALVAIGLTIIFYTDWWWFGAAFLLFAGVTFFWHFVIKPRRK